MGSGTSGGAAREALADRKLLVANRGEIARRVMRSCRATSGSRRWPVTSDADRGAPVRRRGRRGGRARRASPPRSSYLRGDLARRRRASQPAPTRSTPATASSRGRRLRRRRAANAGLTFVGPTPRGDRARWGQARGEGRRGRRPAFRCSPAARRSPRRTRATRRSQVARGSSGFRSWSRPRPEAAAAACARVSRDAELGRRARGGAPRGAGARSATTRSSSSATSTAPRHVEIQILGDAHGHAASTCFERECSIQRRHQKIVEESPSPALDDDLRRRRCATPRPSPRRARIGYRSAGTVEFVLDARRELLLPRGEHAAPGRAPGDRRQVTGPRPRRASRSASRRASACPRQAARDVARARDRGAALRRGPDATCSRRPAVVARFGCRAATGIRVDADVEDGSEVSPYYDSDARQGDRARTDARRRSRASPRRAQAAPPPRRPPQPRSPRRRALPSRVRRGACADTGFLGARTRPSSSRGKARDPSARIASMRSPPLSPRKPDAARPRPVAFAAVGLAERSVRRRVRRWRTRRRRASRTGSPTASIAAIWARGSTARTWARVAATVAPGISGAPEVAGLRRTIEVHAAGDVAFVDSPLGSSELREEPRFPPPPAAGGSGLARGPDAG